MLARNTIVAVMMIGGIALCSYGVAQWVSAAGSMAVKVHLVDPASLDQSVVSELHKTQLRIDNRGATPVRLVGTNAC